MNTGLWYGKLGSRIYDFGSKVTGHRRYFKLFFSQSSLGLKDGDEVLDAGCGSGRLIIACLDEYINKRGIKIRGYAVDHKSEMLELCEKNARKQDVYEHLTLYKGDARNLKNLKPFGPTNGKIISLEDSRFPVVMSSGLIECITEQPEQAAKELERILQENGTCIYSVVKKNPLGIGAGILLRFKTRASDYMLDFFPNIRFAKSAVRTMNLYMKTLQRIYVGKKT